VTDQANSEAQPEVVETEQSDATPTDDKSEDTAQVDEETTLEGEVEEEPVLVDELTAAKNEADDMRDRWMRSVAELENFRKRTARDYTERMVRAADRILLEILTPIDNLARGLKSGKDAASADTQSSETATSSDAASTDATSIDAAQLQGFIEGMELVFNQFNTVLERENVKAMESVGEPFDPSLHEALMVTEHADAEPNTVLDIVERGYLIGDRVLRHAKVVVSKAVTEASEEE
jgi:molecular chaperone GrpE